MGITEALRLQVELQKRLHEQLERDRFFLDRLECKVKQNSYFIS
ncbi:putative MYB-CC type transcription factor, LHEQLE-containing domain-containing protein [Rosa chinensis]|uniref:Putative MYB-CC type transcription factor, LHEQLE-containing domain-containing protein n=2 Tax=Rosa chinensis TaxID=74649 RepID=A0A2P6QB66_ROSCH|nr:putative MYB-CC type transcription factor, LHEQLE-containing domain-containing protein [Rosa chinensis]PRQ59627.1 putative MYB-CC type transcription factor, LHEQLE-containing domain-containing protein [Rosa chinensis]